MATTAMLGAAIVPARKAGGPAEPGGAWMCEPPGPRAGGKGAGETLSGGGGGGDGGGEKGEGNNGGAGGGAGGSGGVGGHGRNHVDEDWLSVASPMTVTVSPS